MYIHTLYVPRNRCPVDHRIAGCSTGLPVEQAASLQGANPQRDCNSRHIGERVSLRCAAASHACLRVQAVSGLWLLTLVLSDS